MKIVVKPQEGRNIRLCLPTRMILSKTACRLFLRSMKKKRLRQAENASSPDEHEPLSETGGEDISEKEDVSRKENVSGKEKPHRYDASDIFANLSKEQLFEVCAVLRDMKRNHPGVPLVEVDSADGDHILIRL